MQFDGPVEAGMQGNRRAAPETVRHEMDPAGATGILTLRCLEASDRWDEIFTQPGATTAA